MPWSDEGEVCVRIDDHPVGLTEGYADDAARTSAVSRPMAFSLPGMARAESTTRSSGPSDT